VEGSTIVDSRTILLIDADAASRIYLRRTLENEGYQILQAASGKEGLICAWRDRPDLFLVDPALPDMKGEELMQKLRQDRRTVAIPAIALSSDPQPQREHDCLSSGFNKYLVKSGQAVPALLEWLAQQHEGAPGPASDGGLLIVFLSAKGGTGTSSLCANIAMNIAKQELEANVAVADMVLPIGSIAPIVGYSEELNLVSVADMPAAETDVDYFRKHLPMLPTWGFWLLAGSPDPEVAGRLKVERIHDLISNLQAAYDYVLIDLGRSLSRISLPIIQQADLIVLVVSTDQSTVTLTKTVWGYLQDQGVDAQRVYAILNRAVGLEGCTKAEAEQLLDLEIKFTMPYMRGDFTLANNQNLPVAVKFPRDTATVVLKESAAGMSRLAYQLKGK
jgi:pilus assembly protein CpaE